MNVTKKRMLVLVMAAVALAWPLSANAAGNPAEGLFLRAVSPDGTLQFSLADHLRLPAFAWPRTLLSYPVRFDAARLRADQLHLRDLVTGKEVPFQLSSVKSRDGVLQFAVVNFFSDLPSGGSRRFELSGGSGAAMPVAVQQQKENDTIVLDAGRLKVRLPASRTIATGQTVPGPILQIARGTKWVGDSALVSRRKVLSLTTETIESGPLFIACRVTYQFEGGASYIATVKAIADYDYVEFAEEMIGLTKADGVAVEQSWTGFSPTHRMIVGSPFGGTHRVDEPIVQPFRGEDPPFTGPSKIEDPAVEMMPDLSPYWPNGWGGNRSASFWDEKSGDAMGLFIADASKWQDHEYAIWTSADTLKVKYRCADGVLSWRWPLVAGTRLTGVTAYRHGAGGEAPANEIPGSAWNEDSVDSVTKGKELPVMLQIRYGDIGLNRVKDWVLEYPDAAKRPPEGVMKPGRQKTPESYVKALPTCAATGVAGGMFHPVGLRDMGYWVVPDYYRFRDQFTAEQRKQATAVLLFAAYVAAEDEYCPMRTMLGGHPNFMADLKFPIAAAAFLFPGHPMANEWREQYVKFMELCGRFYVRPAVPAWEALGGRFTESIATYNWAFMGPTSDANHLGLATGAPNFYATPQLADMGDYLVGILTAPVSADLARKDWPDKTPLTYESGFKRIHPPQGAHSSKRGAGGSMYVIGDQLRSYRPLTAEHMMWGAFPAAGKGFEDRPGQEVGPVNRGTNPHLTSAKYTGYGIVLRAGVDTPDEVSLYLQQVDKGPNYRWGYANQNGSGDIYYYAGGKSYSGHEREEAGDGHVDDAMFTCNTGVYKDWHFWCVGMNDLTRPFYDLQSAQFAEVVPEKGPGAYSWPEYQSRSVMLVGTDYFLVYDRILENCGTRFAWNICRDDEMPIIHHVKGGGDPVELVVGKDKFVRGSLSTMIKGGNSHAAVVTHKKDVQIVPAKRVKGEPPVPYIHVKTSGGEDYLFQGDDEIKYAGKGMTFVGTTGVIRQRKGGQTELSLFHGSSIGDGEVTATVDSTDLGVSIIHDKGTDYSGFYFGRAVGTLTLEFTGGAMSGAAFYVDGMRLKADVKGKALSVKLPPGRHRWEWTTRLPQPPAPVMVRTENRSGGATVFFTATPGAEKYRVEISKDNGVTWQVAGECKSAGPIPVLSHPLTGLANGTKLHVRAVAVNRDRESTPAAEYPIYITDKAPLPPDGLRTQIASGEVKLTWGEVLGVSEYRLYRREKSKGEYKEIFRGLATQYEDKDAKATAAYPEPGLKASATRENLPTVYEYAVAAVSANGEGAKSLSADTNPASWRNWNPTTDLRFKRQSAFWLPPYVYPKDVPPAHYPE